MGEYDGYYPGYTEWLSADTGDPAMTAQVFVDRNVRNATYTD